MSYGFSPVMAVGLDKTRQSRARALAITALALFMCALIAACVVGGWDGEASRSELLGRRSMHDLFQQAKWARLFQGKTLAPPSTALASERYAADAIGFRTALAAAGSSAPVRYPRDVATTRASELEVAHSTPQYLRELSLAAHDTPDRKQQLSQVPQARTQSLDFVETKPRSDDRHPGDMNIYQTYEYYPKPEGTTVDDYDGKHIWEEMQRDYRSQHPSTSTYPAVPVIFQEDSSGGHPVENPLSQPSEDVYQGMSYEDHMQPPYGLGKAKEEKKQTRSTMKLSPREGFEMMKRQAKRMQEPEAQIVNYRNPDWREHFTPRMNADKKSFMATPSVAPPHDYRQQYATQHNAGITYAEQHNADKYSNAAPGSVTERVVASEAAARKEVELEDERLELQKKEELILNMQDKIEQELKEAREAKEEAKEAKKPSAPALSPAQEQLYRWERKHGVDDPSAYTGETRTACKNQTSASTN